jgi:hypothetical protein
MLSTTYGQGVGEAQNWLDNTYTNLISKIGLEEKLPRKKTKSCFDV